MANAKIELISPADVDVVVSIYNEVFSPAQDASFFARRFEARRNISIMIAVVEEHPVGFIIGFELMPTTYFCWLCGVMPEFRRDGIATQLMHAVQAFALDNGYCVIRFECQNQHRPMLHTAITEGYDLVGIRHDTGSGNNVVIFEKELS
ncbi:MAG: GNAT family N-acetyltransferase [Planctomycetota bacterium]